MYMKLYHIILYYTILYHTILYYTILYHTILYCTIIYYTIFDYITVYYTIFDYIMLYYITLYNVIAYITLHPVSITRFPLTRLSPGSGLLHSFFYTINAKIFQSLGLKRRKSCDGDRVYIRSSASRPPSSAAASRRPSCRTSGPRSSCQLLVISY